MNSPATLAAAPPARAAAADTLAAAPGVCRLAGALLLIAADFLCAVPFAGRHSRRARADWQTRSARRLAPLFGLRIGPLRGPCPAGGAVVCNHLGYLDIIALACRMPCVFVAKSDVRAWPVLGALALGAGTVFIDRQRRRDAVRVHEEIRVVLDAGLPVVIFPEGTSSGGDAVLPFKPALFEGLREIGCPITAAAIDYRRPGGSVRDEVAYWRDMPLLPHLLNLLAHPGVDARIAFAPPELPASRDRKTLALAFRAQVAALRVRRPPASLSPIP